jgi:hypothetical protein
MLARSSETIVEVACAGCGRIQRVRASKVIPCDGYLCSYTGCAKNPAFRLPEVPDGWICTFELNAAGVFSGWRVRRATTAEQRSIDRARAIREEGLRLLKQRGSRMPNL